MIIIIIIIVRKVKNYLILNLRTISNENVERQTDMTDHEFEKIDVTAVLAEF